MQAILIFMILYFIQSMCVWLSLTVDDDIIKTKKEVWYWHIPFFPLIKLIYQKYKALK